MRDQPHEVWTVSLDGGYDDAVLAGDALVVVACGDDECHVSRRDAVTGGELWSSDLGGTQATLDARDDEIVVLSPNADGGTDVTVLAATDGAERRRFDLPDRFEFRPHVLARGLLVSSDGEEVAVLTDDDQVANRIGGDAAGLTDELVIVRDHATLAAYDRRTLERVGPVVEVVDGEEAVGTVVDGRMFVGDGRTVLEYSSTGEQRWSLETSLNQIEAIVAAGNERILVVSDEGYGLISVEHGRQGATIWTSDDGRGVEDVIDVDGRWYAVVSSGTSGALQLSPNEAPRLAVVELDGASPREHSAIDGLEGPYPETLVLGDVIYQIDDDESTATLLAASLPDLDPTWRISIGNDERRGEFEVLDGAILGVATDETRTSLTFFR